MKSNSFLFKKMRYFESETSNTLTGLTSFINTISESIKICVTETLWFLILVTSFYTSLGEMTDGLPYINVTLLKTESLISINTTPLVAVIYLEIKIGAVR